MAEITKIILIPLDNRPVSYTLPQQIASLNSSVEIYAPPREFLGGLTENSKVDKILEWLDETLKLEKADYLVVSLDTIAHGGLIPSRRSLDKGEEILDRLNIFRNIVEKNNVKAKIYAFSSIMRISDSYVNEEEKEYWDKFGKEIFKYSFLKHKYDLHINQTVILSDQAQRWERENLSNDEYDQQSSCNNSSLDRSSRYGFAFAEDDIDKCKNELTALKTRIPPEILDDYLKTRERNFSVNRFYLNWAEENFLDFLVFSKDDTGQFGLNVQEAEALQTEIKNKNLDNNATTLTGADEIPSDLVSKALADKYGKKIKIMPVYSTENGKNIISRYEDKTIEECVSAQIKLCGGEVADSAENADMFILVHTPENIQNDHCLKVYAEPENNEAVKFCTDFIKDAQKPVIVGDIACANGADNLLVLQILGSPVPIISKIYGYAGWNTTGNTIGSVISIGISRFIAEKTDKFNLTEFKKTLLTRLSDDWAYQTVVRQKIRAITDIADRKTLKEELVPLVLNLTKKIELNLSEIHVDFPWNRTFEAEIII